MPRAWSLAHSSSPRRVRDARSMLILTSHASAACRPCYGTGNGVTLPSGPAGFDQRRPSPGRPDE